MACSVLRPRLGRGHDLVEALPVDLLEDVQGVGPLTPDERLVRLVPPGHGGVEEAPPLAEELLDRDGVGHVRCGRRSARPLPSPSWQKI
jgi:hypothetical protein